MSDTTFPSVGQRPLGLEGAGRAALSSILLLAGLSAARALIQLLGVNNYGFFRDELYYIACSHHLAWGYIDQPPLIALVAWLARHTFGESLIAYRILPVLAGAGTVLLTGLLARELGGGLLAQFLAATTILLAPLSLAFDSFLSMNAFEPLFWLLCAWIAVRIVKGGSPRLWILFGAVAGVGLENKHTMLVFCFALVAGLALSGELLGEQSNFLSSRWTWLGALIAFAFLLPNLIWEATNGWPQIEVVRTAQQFKNVELSPLRFIGEQVLFMQPLSIPIWFGGIVWCFFEEKGRRFRFLGWAYLIVMAVFIVLHGKSYYVIPIYPVLAAAGGVAFEQFTTAPMRGWVRFGYPVVLVLGGLSTVPFGVPLLPVETFIRYTNAVPYARSVKTENDATAALPQNYADMIGWEHMAETIAGVYHNLPKAEQSQCAILGGNYGEAGAIDFYGPKLGVPPAISGHNNYFLWGPRNYSGECLILFGERAEQYKNYFNEVQLVATISDPLAMPSEQNLSVYICRRPQAALRVLWPRFRLVI
jgi:hypothetical protein